MIGLKTHWLPSSVSSLAFCWNEYGGDGDILGISIHIEKKTSFCFAAFAYSWLSAQEHFDVWGGQENHERGSVSISTCLFW